MNAPVFNIGMGEYIVDFGNIDSAREKIREPLNSRRRKIK